MHVEKSSIHGGLGVSPYRETSSASRICSFLIETSFRGLGSCRHGAILRGETLTKQIFRPTRHGSLMYSLCPNPHCSTSGKAPSMKRMLLNARQYHDLKLTHNPGARPVLPVQIEEAYEMSYLGARRYDHCGLQIRRCSDARAFRSFSLPKFAALPCLDVPADSSMSNLICLSRALFDLARNDRAAN